ncbi:hypothetical protein B484DRAFT_407447 [Ochromonadaceae sp. CCMP2298]|nr:hypothetical protein B484DRAFT_407447 [Ochromonadaceae sp. CCMP2298]
MADNAEEGHKTVTLKWKNCMNWKKYIEHETTAHGDAGVEIKERTHALYKQSHRTETVTELVELNGGQLIPETRAWSTARDQNTLNSREQTYAKKIDAIKKERGLVWTLLFRHCSSSVISAVAEEEEPIPGNYILKSGTALSTQMNTDASEKLIIYYPPP